jgi:predicted nucleic acid-binding protein
VSDPEVNPVAAGADWIVSGDADLLSINRYQGIAILTAAQALTQLAD